MPLNNSKRDVAEAFGPRQSSSLHAKKRRTDDRSIVQNKQHRSLISADNASTSKASATTTAVLSPATGVPQQEIETAPKSSRRRRRGRRTGHNENTILEEREADDLVISPGSPSDLDFHTPTQDAFIWTEDQSNHATGDVLHPPKSRHFSERTPKDESDDDIKGFKDSGTVEVSEARSLSCPIESCPRHTAPFTKESRLSRHMRTEHPTDQNMMDLKEQSPHSLALSLSNPRNQRREKKRSRQEKRRDKWNLTAPISGTFINHDPILSFDGQYMILPTRSDIQIFAIKTSLLVRKLCPNEDAEIHSCCLDLSNTDQLFVGLSNGVVLKWNWTTGIELFKTLVSINISGIASLGQDNDNQKLLVLQEPLQGSDVLSLVRLNTAGELSQSQTLLEKPGLQGSFLCFDREGIIVIYSLKAVFIGISPIDGNRKNHYGSWNFHEVNVPGRIICCHAHVTQRQIKSGSKLPVVDVAVGLKSGVIQVYNDLLWKVNAAGKGKPADLVPAKLHWHRNRVNTVKWSRDGEYLISGGHETVLVIWQLDTNNQQFLPHLSTPILNLSVSQSGDAYALRLGDNSVMILSTADLKPAANVSGLAISGSRPNVFMHPLRPNQMLAITSSEARTVDARLSKSSNLLQTFDIGSAIQLNKQALARNLLTTIKTGPNGQTLREPEVSHVKITNDGSWLITVDDWTPQTEDLNGLYINEGDREARESRKESFLRFWSFNAGDESWELNTRIDEPVSQSYRTVLAIAVHPSKAQVSTAGSDGVLKIWSPKTRMRNGQIVKNHRGEALSTWTCDHTITLEMTQLEPSSAAARSAAATFSEDGSILAVSWSSPGSSHRHVHLVNPRDGNICFTQSHLLSHDQASLAIHGRYLICLSRKLCIFDLVSMQCLMKMTIDDAFEHNRSLLAVNAQSSTIAVSVSPRNHKYPSHLSVYSIVPQDKKPTYETKVKGQVRALLPSNNHGGYVVIDNNACIQQLMPPGGVAIKSVGSSLKDTEELNKGLDNIFGAMSSIQSIEDRKTEDTNLRKIEGHNENTLEEVFNIQSTARAPGLTDLFNSVANAVSSIFKSS